MKKLFFLLTVISLSVFSSCKESEEEDWIWDFSNLGFEFCVIDPTTGANLLDPETPGNILDNEITVEYAGNIYDVYYLDGSCPYPTYDEAGPRSRALYPINLALRYATTMWKYDKEAQKGDYIYNPYLFFGEFYTGGNLHDEEFTINWGDGTSNKIKFNCYVEWKSKNNPVVHHEYWLDGKQLESSRIDIYKNPKQ